MVIFSISDKYLWTWKKLWNPLNPAKTPWIKQQMSKPRMNCQGQFCKIPGKCRNFHELSLHLRKPIHLLSNVVFFSRQSEMTGTSDINSNVSRTQGMQRSVRQFQNDKTISNQHFFVALYRIHVSECFTQFSHTPAATIMGMTVTQSVGGCISKWHSNVAFSMKCT